MGISAEWNCPRQGTRSASQGTVVCQDGFLLQITQTVQNSEVLLSLLGWGYFSGGPAIWGLSCLLDPTPGRLRADLCGRRQVHPHHGPRQSLPLSLPPGRQSKCEKRPRGLGHPRFPNCPSLLRPSPCLLKCNAKVNWTVFSQKRLAWCDKSHSSGRKSLGEIGDKARWGIHTCRAGEMVLPLCVSLALGL